MNWKWMLHVIVGRGGWERALWGGGENVTCSKSRNLWELHKEQAD